ncbi:unnamed protein product [Gemmata massiliana]|uniref:Uncharacterized protein n=1 Tax=Gemmata massiliana TaxID=1210884 RepID=A0A6P2DAJ8_9BACT|nr:hypothetical protein [Gemmata massiliana]VTR98268.1 unnamed protein product [Gemmata massiliana]
MPNIQVTCPECKSVLEIGAEFAGQEIECGSCLHVFIAETRPARPDSAGRSGSGARRRSEEEPEDREQSRSARSSRRRDEDDDEDDSDRRSARRRRDEEEDDDFDYSPPRPSNGPGAASVAALVLGLLSTFAVPVTCCGCCSMITWPVTIPLGLGAIITGAFGINDPKGKPLAITGMVFGAVSLAFVALQMIGFAPIMVPPGAPR